MTKIGMAYISEFPFYDKVKKKHAYKRRPILIIGKSDSEDYLVLPISRITNKNNLDFYYDVKLEIDNVKLMKLRDIVS